MYATFCTTKLLVHFRHASDNLSISDSSQTDSDSCNSPQVVRANRLAMRNIIPKFAISSEEDKPTSPKVLIGK